MTAKNGQIELQSIATTPDHIEYIGAAGGEVRFYNDFGKWRYVCAMGEGSDLESLEDAINEVREFVAATV